MITQRMRHTVISPFQKLWALRGPLARCLTLPAPRLQGRGRVVVTLVLVGVDGVMVKIGACRLPAMTWYICRACVLRLSQARLNICCAGHTRSELRLGSRVRSMLAGRRLGVYWWLLGPSLAC